MESLECDYANTCMLFQRYGSQPKNRMFRFRKGNCKLCHSFSAVLWEFQNCKFEENFTCWYSKTIFSWCFGWLVDVLANASGNFQWNFPPHQLRCIKAVHSLHLFELNFMWHFLFLIRDKTAVLRSVVGFILHWNLKWILKFALRTRYQKYKTVHNLCTYLSLKLLLCFIKPNMHVRQLMRLIILYHEITKWMGWD